jgi:D-hydroxyproline dehydrogenase subunit beta
MSGTYDLIIVGAGIVGAASAAACSAAGLKVLVLDSGHIGGGTTGAGMGHLVVMDDSEAQFALTSYSLSLWHQLAPALPTEVEFDQCGTLWLAADEQEMAEVHRKKAFYAERGVRVEILNEAEVSRAEPNLRAGMAGQAKGAEVRQGVAAAQCLTEGGVKLQDGEKINAGRSLNATGPWSPTLTRGLPVRKRKGHLVITDRYPGFVHHQIVELGYLKSAHKATEDSVAFNIQPRKNGQMLIGSSRQYDAETNTVDQAILDRMLKRALEYLPALGHLSAIRVWTGHRAATPDKLPLIGPSLESNRVWLATGHEGLGITTSLATGRLIADLLLGRAPAIPVEPYSPSRFANC